MAKPIEEVTILDILEAVEEGVILAPCTNSDHSCGRTDECILSQFWDDTEKEIRRHLSKQTIKTILESYA